MNGYPDFVLFHPRRGLLIIEVKDWKRDTIGRLDRYQATLLVDGREKRAPNSLEQARECAIAMELACRFAREVLSPKEADEDGIPLLAPESAGRRGERPQLLRFGDEAAEAAFVAERARAMHGSGVARRDMAVLYRVKEQGRRLAARLAQAGVPASDFGDRGRLDPGNDTIKLMTYHSSKGLEFPVVFMPCLECMPLMKDDVAGEAKLLYVGMTRAMERLVLTHHGDSRFVAEVAEALAA